MNQNHHSRRISRTIVVAVAGVAVGLATTYAVASGSEPAPDRAPSEQMPIAAWATERQLSGLSPASIGGMANVGPRAAAHTQALADYAREHRLSGLSPASLTTQDAVPHPAAHMRALADYAREHGLSGLSPASLAPVDD